jgi:hypothetical protein
MLDAAGDSDEQQPGFTRGSAKGMREPARQEDEAARDRLELLVATGPRHRACKHIEALVFASVNVTWRPLADDRLQHRQRTAGGCRRGLRGQTASGDSRTGADYVPRKIWHESEYGSGPRTPPDSNTWRAGQVVLKPVVR